MVKVVALLPPLTVTVNVQGNALLFAASLALYVTVVTPIGNAEPTVNPAVGLVVTEGVIFVVQLSVIVGIVHVATAVVPVAVKEILAGQFVIVGGKTSGEQGFAADTVTVNIQGNALLFAASFALYVTVVTPIGNAEPRVNPAVGLVVTEGVIFVVQLSVIVGTVHVATAVVPVAVKLILAGQFVIVGGKTSGEQGFAADTVTVNTQGNALLFAASFALYVTVVTPIGNAEPRVNPAVGLVVTEGVIFVVQLSVIVGTVHVATAVVPVAVKEILAGQFVIVGGKTSGEQGFAADTVTVNVQGNALLLAASLALYVTVVTPIGNAEPRVNPAVGLVVTEGVIFVVQLSVIVGTVHVATAVVPVAVKEILAGQFVIVGGKTSGEQGFVPVVYSIIN